MDSARCGAERKNTYLIAPVAIGVPIILVVLLQAGLVIKMFVAELAVVMVRAVSEMLSQTPFRVELPVTVFTVPHMP